MALNFWQQYQQLYFEAILSKFWENVFYYFRANQAIPKENKHIFMYDYTLKEYISQVPYFQSY